MKKLLGPISIAVLLSTAAFAQEATQAAPATPTTSPLAPADPAAPAADSAEPGQVVTTHHLASAILGESVYNSTAENAEEVGEVKDIVIDANGAAVSLIVGVGGFLGIGERNVAVEFKSAKWAEKDGDRWLVVETSKEQLEAMPPFDAAVYAPVPVMETAPAAPATDPAAPAPAVQPAPATGSETPAPAPATSETPAVITPDGAAPADAPVEGANSFTEAQAKSRMEEGGYTAVGALKKDDQGIWRGKATKDGKEVSVSLDYQGNVVAN